MLVKFNMTPYLSEALAIKPEIYDDIDKVYNTRIKEIQQAAKDSEYYTFADKAALNISVYYRKAIGIIEFSVIEQGNEVYEHLFYLLKKAYGNVYSYVAGKNKVKLSEALLYFTKNGQNLSVNEFCANFTVIQYFASITGTEVEYDSMEFFEFFKDKENIMENPLTLERFQQNKKLYGKAKSRAYKLPRNLTMESVDEEIFPLLYELEDFDFYSFTTANEKIHKRDIMEICCIYEYIEENDFDFDTYFIAACHIKMLLKEYRKAIELYKKNCNENLQIAFDRLSSENAELKKENKHLQYKASLKPLTTDTELQIKIRKQEKEIAKLKKELDEANASKMEINALRTFMFNQEQENTYIENTTDVALPDTGVLIVGGYSDWQNKLKNDFPNWKYIEVEQLSTLSTSILDNINYLIFNTLRLSHKMYYKLIDIARSRDNISIGYINSTNIDISKKIISEIVKNK